MEALTWNLIVSIIAFFICFFIMILTTEKPKSEKAFFSAVIMVIVFILGGLLTEEIPSQSIIISREGIVKGIFAERTSLWRWDDRFLDEGGGYSKIVSYKRKEVKVAVRNPVYNPLVNECIFEIYGTPESFLKMYRIKQEPEVWLKHCLYAFLITSRQELVVFHDPTDKRQQKNYESFVRMNLQLENWATLKSTKFRLE